MYHVCAAIFPLIERSVIEDFVRAAGFIPSSSQSQAPPPQEQTSFVSWLLASVGRASNVWGRVSDNSANMPNAANTPPPLSHQARECGEAEYGLAMAQLTLLRALCTSSLWRSAVADCINAEIDGSLYGLIHTLKKEALQELNSATAPGAVNSESVTAGPVGGARVDALYGILSLLGGDFPVIYAGALAVCFDDKSNIREDCLVLGYTAVPEGDIAVDKETASLWKNASPYGDAVAVMLLSNPSKHITVHRKRLEFSTSSFISSSSVSTTAAGDTADSSSHCAVSDFLEKSIGADRLSRLFSVLSSISTVDTRPVPQPRLVEAIEELVFESAHPYQENLNTYTRVDIPGAESLSFEFDSRCATTLRKDYVVIYKDLAHSEAWGTKFTGSEENGNWPGCSGRRPLKIRASSAELHFHTGSASEGLWGYKCTVKGKIVKEILPPPLPTLPHFAQLVHIKMLAMKALQCSLQSCSWLVPHSLALMRNLVDSALAPAPENACLSTQVAAPVTLMYESDHPYENSMDLYTPVCIPGARRLSIVFDPQTRTENGCDYLMFYTDSSHSIQVPGSENYTGGRDNGSNNWPGLQGRAPLVIEGDSFELYFHSDSSVNDWGYKMFITAEFSTDGAGTKKTCIRGENMSPQEAASHCYYLQQYLLDGPVKEPTFSEADAKLFPTRPPRKVCGATVEAEDLAATVEVCGQKGDFTAESKEESPDVPLIESKTADLDDDRSRPTETAISAASVVHEVDIHSSWPVLKVNPTFGVYFPQGYQVSTANGIPLLDEVSAESAPTGAAAAASASLPEGATTQQSAAHLQLKNGVRILALEQRGDFMKVQFNRRDSEPKKAVEVVVNPFALHATATPEVKVEEPLCAVLPFADMMESVTVSLSDVSGLSPNSPIPPPEASTNPATAVGATATADASAGDSNSKGVEASPFTPVKADAGDDDKKETEEQSRMTAWVRWRDQGRDLLSPDCSVPGSVPRKTSIPIDYLAYVDKSLIEAAPSAQTRGNAPPPPRVTTFSSKDSQKDPKPTRHPMYAVANSCDTSAASNAAAVTAATSSAQNSSSSFYKAQHLSPSALVTSELRSLESAMVDYAAVAALGYAYEALRVIIAHWPADVVLSLGYFGSFSQLLTYLNLSLQRSGGGGADSNSSGSSSSGGGALVNPSEMLLSLLRNHESARISTLGATATTSAAVEAEVRRPALSLALIEFALTRLHRPNATNTGLFPTTAASDDSSSRPQVDPVSLAEVAMSRIFFSEDGATHEMQFAGCKKIILKWNLQAAKQLAGSTLMITSHSRLNNPVDGTSASESVNDVSAPLVYEFGEKLMEIILPNCDHCTVQFIPNKNANPPSGMMKAYGGLMLTAQGVYEEPDEQALRTYANKQFAAEIAKDADRKRVCYPQLACWILHSYVTDNCATLRAELFNKRTFRLLRQFYDSPQAAEVKEMLMLLLVSFISAFTAQYELLPQSLLSEFKDLQSALIRSATTRYGADTKNGSDLRNMSPELQAIVQLIVSIDTCISKVQMPLVSATTSAAIAPSKSSSKDPGEGQGKMEDNVEGDGAVIGEKVVADATLTAADGTAVSAKSDDVTDSAGSSSSRRFEGPSPGDFAYTLLIRDVPVAVEEAAVMTTAMVTVIPLTTSERAPTAPTADESPHEAPTDATAVTDTTTTAAAAAQHSLVIGLCRRHRKGSDDSARSPKILVGLSADGFVVFGNISTGVLKRACTSKVCRALRTGDLVTLKVNSVQGTVTFFLNGALLGLIVGRKGSQALLETTGDLRGLIPCGQVASTLVQPVVVPNPAAMWKPTCFMGFSMVQAPLQASSEPKLPEWLDKVIAANALLSNIDRQEVPSFVLASMLLPVVSTALSEQVKLTNEVFTSPAIDCTFSSPGATMIKVCIQRSHLLAGDLLEVVDASGATVVSIKSRGKLLDRPAKDLFAFVRKLCTESAKTVQTLATCSPTEWEDLEEGDLVVRGPDWMWGDVDGGSGSVGRVTKVQRMFVTAQPEYLEVTVRWLENQHERVHRYGHMGQHDIVMLQPAPLTALDNECCLDIVGDKLTFRVTKVTPEPEGATRSINLLFVPLFTLQNCLALPEARTHLDHIRRLYVMKSSKSSGALEGALALAKHLDSVAVAKKYSMYDLVKKNWSQCSPSEEELTRSPHLKALFEEALEGKQLYCRMLSPSSVNLTTVTDALLQPKYSFEPPSSLFSRSQASSGNALSPADAAVAAAASHFSARRRGVYEAAESGASVSAAATAAFPATTAVDAAAAATEFVGGTTRIDAPPAATNNFVGGGGLFGGIFGGSRNLPTREVQRIRNGTTTTTNSNISNNGFLFGTSSSGGGESASGDAPAAISGSLPSDSLFSTLNSSTTFGSNIGGRNFGSGGNVPNGGFGASANAHSGFSFGSYTGGSIFGDSGNVPLPPSMLPQQASNVFGNSTSSGNGDSANAPAANGGLRSALDSSIGSGNAPSGGFGAGFNTAVGSTAPLFGATTGSNIFGSAGQPASGTGGATTAGQNTFTFAPPSTFTLTPEQILQQQNSIMDTLAYLRRQREEALASQQNPWEHQQQSVQPPAPPQPLSSAHSDGAPETIGDVLDQLQQSRQAAASNLDQSVLQMPWSSMTYQEPAPPAAAESASAAMVGEDGFALTFVDIEAEQNRAEERDRRGFRGGGGGRVRGRNRGWVGRGGRSRGRGGWSRSRSSSAERSRLESVLTGAHDDDSGSGSGSSHSVSDSSSSSTSHSIIINSDGAESESGSEEEESGSESEEENEQENEEEDEDEQAMQALMFAELMGSEGEEEGEGGPGEDDGDEGEGEEEGSELSDRFNNLFGESDDGGNGEGGGGSGGGDAVDVTTMWNTPTELRRSQDQDQGQDAAEEQDEEQDEEQEEEQGEEVSMPVCKKCSQALFKHPPRTWSKLKVLHVCYCPSFICYVITSFF